MAVACMLLAVGCERHTESAPAPRASAPASTPPRPLPAFSKVAETTAQARLFDLGSRTFVIASRILYSADDKGLHQDVGLLAGFGGRIAGVSHAVGEGYSLMGRWPDAAWLSAWSRGGAPGRPETWNLTYRWVRDRWQRVDVTRGDEALLGVASWRNGSALALIGDAHGVRLTPANSLGQLDVTPTASSHDGCRTALAGRSLGARPPEESAIVAFQSGPVLLAGTRCDAPGRLAVERLSPRGPSTLTDLPAAKPATNPSFELAAASEKDVHLLERESGQLWHFDGTRWSHSEGGPYLAIAVSRQNTFWVVTARNLAFRRPGEDLVSVPLELAPGEELREISAPSDDDVWLLSQRGEQRVLRASGPSRGPLERLPGDDAHWSRGIQRQPLSPVCQQPYVLLLSRVNPKETAFAGVQQRLKGLEGVQLVTELGPLWTQLGATVRSIPVGRQVIERMRGYPRAHPTLFCHAPKVARVIAPL